MAGRLYEAGLLRLGGGRRGLDGGSLQLEIGLGRLLDKLRLRFGDTATGGEWTLLDVGEIPEGSRRVAGRQGIVAQCRRLGASETGRVGSGLAAELGEVEVGPRAVSQVHGLGEAALGVVAVEDDAVQDDADGLNDDLDDDADQGPVLQAADERIVDLVLEDRFPLVVGARPAPHVLVVGVVTGVLEQGSCDSPKNHVEDEL